MTKNVKLLASMLILALVGVGLKYFYINPKAKKSIEQVLKKNDYGYKEVSCSGLMSTDCSIDLLSQQYSGLKIEQINIDDVQQFAKIDKKNKEPIDLDLDIELKDLKVKEAASGLVALASFYRLPFNPSIIPLFVEDGDVYINGKVRYKNGDITKFEKFGISVKNKFLPFSLYVSGANKMGVSEYPLNTSLKEIYLKIDFSKKRELVKFINNNMYRLYRSPKDIDKTIKNIEKDILKMIKKEKKSKRKTLWMQGEDELLNALEKIAKEDDNILEVTVRFPGENGVMIGDLFDNQKVLNKISISAETD